MLNEISDRTLDVSEFAVSCVENWLLSDYLKMGKERLEELSLYDNSEVRKKYGDNIAGAVYTFQTTSMNLTSLCWNRDVVRLTIVSITYMGNMTKE